MTIDVAQMRTEWDALVGEPRSNIQTFDLADYAQTWFPEVLARLEVLERALRRVTADPSDLPPHVAAILAEALGETL